ncbi:PREDICTED: BTB/POZ domain-containing protein KCTD19-like [Haliaeetus leucocephalus]|uniref:BTB/POZ domain-containing protein KCTD19-like n=1 Tax=Haliaeetus leucocephalus TaxID=52644 RepID=UPI0005224A34|nr:PREDICTED: BTB/POZ domain-containing protein KCTD19-like [Haliaeetus albicilla]XP_010583498.1 PREDICTED: BTB/POZ domain-containing protein KCTD19-like [Haliaeetus leucocephalus]
MRSTLTKKVESKDSASHIQKLISLVKEWDAVNCKRGFDVKLNLYSFTETKDGKQTDIILADHRNVGLILKVEHPPVLDNDGFCISNEETVVCLQNSGMAASWTLEKLRHYRKIFYARKCHFFLTNVRLKDPKEITAKAGTLMNRLCFTLPFMWKYSHCLDLLIQRGFARLVSYFALQIQGILQLPRDIVTIT